MFYNNLQWFRNIFKYLNSFSFFLFLQVNSSPNSFFIITLIFQTVSSSLLFFELLTFNTHLSAAADCNFEIEPSISWHPCNYFTVLNQRRERADAAVSFNLVIKWESLHRPHVASLQRWWCKETTSFFSAFHYHFLNDKMSNNFDLNI